MSMLDAAAQCWASKDCVKWEAVAVAIAAAALGVSWLSVLVTAASAAAVYWLGRQANSLALGTHAVTQEQRRVEAEAQRLERQREEQVLLCYLHVSLEQIAIETSTLNAELQPGEPIDVEHFVTNVDARARAMIALDNLPTEAFQTVLPRLHVVEPETGMAVARLTGLCLSIKRSLSKLKGEDSPGSLPVTRRELQDSWLRTIHGRLLNETALAEREVRELRAKSRAVVTGAAR